MQEIKITENQAGQRFDKFLFKYFKEATSGFIYKPSQQRVHRPFQPAPA